MPIKSNKTISANTKGIVVSFTDVNRNTYIPYSNKYVIEKQLEPKPKYQHIEQSVFNVQQQKIYALSIYGLSVFSKEEVQKLAPEEKTKIIRNYTRIQSFLNKWKQELAEAKVNNLLLSLFHNSKIIKDFCSVNGYDKDHKDFHTFKELGLTQQVIAKKLVEQKLLPKNFFQLT
jgi:hypothetical protein